MSTALPPQFVVCHGVVHGRTITLDESLELPEGQRVEVRVVRQASGHEPQAAGHGPTYAGGGSWADAGPELEQWLEEVYQARSSNRPVIEP
jgi:hypothetical protein